MHCPRTTLSCSEVGLPQAHMVHTGSHRPIQTHGPTQALIGSQGLTWFPKPHIGHINSHGLIGSRRSMQVLMGSHIPQASPRSHVHPG